MQCAALGVWLLSLSITGLRFIRFAAHVRASFLIMPEFWSMVWACPILFVHPPVDGHLGSLHLWTITSNAAGNAGMQAVV